MIGVDSKLLTINEVIKMSKVSRVTVNRDIKSNKLPTIKFGGNIRIREDDAAAYAEEKLSRKRYYEDRSDKGGQ